MPPPIFYKKRCWNRIENCGCAESAELLLSSSTFPVRIPIHSDIGGGRGVGTEQKKMIRMVPCMCHQLTDFPTRFRAGGLSSPDWQFSWLKGTVSRDFLCLWFFSWISFPQAPEYTIRAVSNFFSGRYLQLKVDHRYQRHRWQICHRYQRHRRQILPPVSLVFLIPSANLPPVSTTPAANLPPVSLTPVANKGINIRLQIP